MGKKNKNKGLTTPKPPKPIKNKTHYEPSKNETFLVVINPPRRPGSEVPNERHLQTWLSAVVGNPDGVEGEMYVIRTHREPILRLENVDLSTMPILGLHRWREFIRDMKPGHPLWNEQTVIAEYDVKRCNHPKNIQYVDTILERPDPQMYAGVIQPYPRPHAVDLSRDDLGFTVSGRAKQIINGSSFPKPPIEQHNGDAPKAEHDRRLDLDFDGVDQKMADPRPNLDFNAIEQGVNTESKPDPRRELDFKRLEQDLMPREDAERTRASASGAAASTYVKQEVGQVKQEDVQANETVQVEHEVGQTGGLQVKQEGFQVKREGNARDHRHDFDFDRIEQDVKAFASPSLAVDTGDSSMRVKEEVEARSFSNSHLQPKADPEDSKDGVLLAQHGPQLSTVKVESHQEDAAPYVKPDPEGQEQKQKYLPAISNPVKQEDHTRSTEYGGAGDRGRGTFPPPAPADPRVVQHSVNGGQDVLREGAIKRERPQEDEQVSKRLKTEH
ncbi:hypothetical protein PENSPDRAFT_651030 [Peniophora sp. CONT]|nr:hypothetical protein PENSPDRAFT_651030 [Peniophora sp. CONT]